MSTEKMTLMDRLKNPAWEHDATTGTAKLNIEQTRETMDEAADLIGAITALLKFAGQ